MIEECARFYFEMVPFDGLPTMIVYQLLITVTFYINAFVWMKGVSKSLPSLTTIEGTTLDYHLHFRVTCGEFVQTCEGTSNDMSPRTVDALAFGTNANMQCGIRYCSLGTGHVLQRQ